MHVQLLTSASCCHSIHLRQSLQYLTVFSLKKYWILRKLCLSTGLTSICGCWVVMSCFCLCSLPSSDSLRELAYAIDISWQHATSPSGPDQLWGLHVLSRHGRSVEVRYATKANHIITTVRKRGGWVRRTDRNTSFVETGVKQVLGVKGAERKSQVLKENKEHLTQRSELFCLF